MLLDLRLICKIKMDIFYNWLNFVEKLGLMGWPLVLCSVLTLSLIAERSWFFCRLRASEEDTQEAWLRGVEAVNLLPESPLKRLLMAHLEWKSSQWELRNEAATSILRSWVNEQRKPLSLLRLLAQIAPLMGLTGTVLGLIKAFQVIQTQSQGVNPSILAGGIWEALLTTVVGMLICIPALIAIRIFRTRLNDTVQKMLNCNAWIRLQEQADITYPQSDEPN